MARNSMMRSSFVYRIISRSSSLPRSVRRLPPSRSLSSEVPEKVEYVHPLSQIVLEHLQKSRSDWVVNHGLEKGLEVQKDGTFVLKFRSYEQDKARIWTSYDTESKKHWLTVHKGDLVGRYLLQDNMKPAWNDSTSSTPEKITAAVDSMIDKINDNEGSHARAKDSSEKL